MFKRSSFLYRFNLVRSELVFDSTFRIHIEPIDSSVMLSPSSLFSFIYLFFPCCCKQMLTLHSRPIWFRRITIDFTTRARLILLSLEFCFSLLFMRFALLAFMSAEAILGFSPVANKVHKKIGQSIYEVYGVHEIIKSKRETVARDHVTNEIK